MPALSDSTPTNWLLTAHPDLYLFGSMIEAEMFGVNDERAPPWKARRDEIFDEIEKLSNKIARRRRHPRDGSDAVASVPGRASARPGHDRWSDRCLFCHSPNIARMCRPI